MATASLTTFNPIFKDDYIGPMRDGLNNRTVGRKRIKKVHQTKGDNAVIPIRWKRNSGVGARGETDTLPDPGSQGFVVTNPPLRGNYGRIKLTGRLMAAAKSDADAFSRAVDAEMRGLEKDLARDMNRQFFRSGTGILGKCGVTSASTTITLATGTDMRFFEIGQHVDVLTMTTGAVVASDREITAMNKTAAPPTITVDGAALTTAATHAVYRHNSRNKEEMGLDGIINTSDPDDVDVTNSGVGSLQGLAVATYDFWKGVIVSNSGTAGTNATLNLHKIQQMIDDVDIDNGYVVSILICYHRVREEAFKLLKGDQRFVGTTVLDGGFTAIQYSSTEKVIPLVVDRDCYPKTTLYGPCEEELAFFRQSDFDWMDKDGAVLSRVPDEDAYEATLLIYEELGTFMRNAHGRLDDISVDA